MKRCLRTFGVFATLLLGACWAFAAEMPQIVTVGVDAYAQTTDNVVGQIEGVACTNGVYTIEVSFSSEPSAAPSVEFVFNGANGARKTVFCDERHSGFPTQSREVEGRYTYAYTLSPDEGVTLPEIGRVAVRRRLRWGSPTAGRAFEGGGFAVIDDEGNVWMGYTGSIQINATQAMTFKGGVYTGMTTVDATEETEAASAVMTLDLWDDDETETVINTPTNVNGKTMAFPIRRKAE